MKLVFKFLFIVCVIILTSSRLCAGDSTKYNVVTGGLTIGVLNWDLFIDDGEYVFEVTLKSKRYLTSLLGFSGSYLVRGSVYNDSFTPSFYSQDWKTSKKNRKIEIVFKKNKVFKLTQTPPEHEFSRITYEETYEYSDPLTSFLNILSGYDESKTIDGRRVYSIVLGESKSQNIKNYTIKNFKNIWADHKRNDLDQIKIINEKSSYAPKEIHITFKDRVFKLIKD